MHQGIPDDAPISAYDLGTTLNRYNGYPSHKQLYAESIAGAGLRKASQEDRSGTVVRIARIEAESYSLITSGMAIFAPEIRSVIHEIAVEYVPDANPKT